MRALAQALTTISAGRRAEALEAGLSSGPEALSGLVADLLDHDHKAAVLSEPDILDKNDEMKGRPEAELLLFIDQFEEPSPWWTRHCGALSSTG